jgi:hypothetical protein
MGKLTSRMIWGAILITAGILFLLESLGFLIIGSVWPVVFGIAGVLFLLSFIRDTHQWWAVIPGLTLLSLAIVVLLNTVAPKLADLINGGVFLGFLGLSFIIILISTRGQQWWAIIPGGTLLTLASLAVLSPYITGDLSGAILFLGFACTFAIIYLIPSQRHRMRWALYPSIILVIIGALLLSSAFHLARFIVPAFFIVMGLYVILKNVRGKDVLSE